MGSRLGPVLANLFMGYYETMSLNAFPEYEIILYRRYVDDIICLLNCESAADKFFEFLNNILTSNLHLENKLIYKFHF